MRSGSVAPAVGIAPDPADARHAGRIHAHLTALPGLLAEEGLAEVHVEGRDRRTGTLVAYSFVTIHRALALHVAEAVRVALARLGWRPGPNPAGRNAIRATASGRPPRAPTRSRGRPRAVLTSRANISSGTDRAGPRPEA